MTQTAGKVWGSTALIHHDQNVEVHVIEIKKQHCCSWHVHKSKYNEFYVIRGTLIIEVEKGYGLTDRTMLKAGQKCVVPPNERHRFVCVEDCIATEVYYVKLDPNDIERGESHGYHMDPVEYRNLLIEMMGHGDEPDGQG